MKTKKFKQILFTLSFLFLSIPMLMANEGSSVVAPPSNDLIENAIDIDLGPFPYSELSVNFPEATHTNDTPGGACGVAAPAVWYKFTVARSALVSAVMVNAQDPIVIFFSAPHENVTVATELTYIDQSTNPCEPGSTSTIETTADTTYYILMKNDILSDVLININSAMVPPNDLIEDAIDLTEGDYPYTDENVEFNHATFEHDATVGNCTVNVAGVWYKFTARTSGNVHASITSNPAIPYIIFFSAPHENVTDGSELTFVQQPGNDCALGDSASLMVTAGTTYYIYMKNEWGSEIIININEALVPSNDLIINATNLNGYGDFNDQDIIFAAATSTGDSGQSGCDPSPVKPVWYKFTAPIDGEVIAGIGVDQGDGGVIFYTAPDENVSDASELTWVDVPSNPCEPNNLSSIDATAGTTYYLFAALVEGFQVADVSVNLNGILSLGENVLQGFTYYPNPATHELHIQAQDLIDEVAIFNVVGQKVLSQKINATAKNLHISHLNAGMYIMQVRANGTTATYKILKQ